MKTRLIFVCSRNKWRSPTAEALFRDHPQYESRSAGTADSARVKITADHLGWADLIFCMEKKHADQLLERFPEALVGKSLNILHIPDNYGFMDPVLIGLLQTKLAAHLKF